MTRFPSVATAAVVLGLAVATAIPARAEVPGVKVTTDKTIDNSSLETIVAQVFERSAAKTNDEKAVALYEYLHNTIFHHAYPTETNRQTVGPLKVINVYGWGLCGGQHTVLKALYETAGWECRYVGWSNPGHTTIEVKYDGRWHYFDVFLKCYYWSRDKKYVVSQEEIAADPGLVLDAVKEGRAARQNLCCGDEAAGVVQGVKSRKIAGNSKGWASVTWRDENWSTALNLPAAAALKLDWKGEADSFAISGKAPQHSCGNKDIRSDSVLGPIAEHYGARNWSNGSFRYEPDFAKAGDLADVEVKGAVVKGGKLVASAGAGSAVFMVGLPYPYVRAVANAGLEGEGKVSVSTDGGKTWSPAAAGGDVSALVKQRYDVRFKVEFAGTLSSFSLGAVVEHNRYAQPYLVNGKNVVTVAAGALPKGSVLAVTYTYQEATVADPAKRKRFDGSGVSYGPVKSVTKEVTSVPFSFTVDVGGNTPPKMVSLECAVRTQ